MSPTPRRGGRGGRLPRWRPRVLLGERGRVGQCVGQVRWELALLFADQPFSALHAVAQPQVVVIESVEQDGLVLPRTSCNGRLHFSSGGPHRCELAHVLQACAWTLRSTSTRDRQRCRRRSTIGTIRCNSEDRVCVSSVVGSGKVLQHGVSPNEQPTGEPGLTRETVPARVLGVAEVDSGGCFKIAGSWRVWRAGVAGRGGGAVRGRGTRGVSRLASTARVDGIEGLPALPIRPGPGR